MNHSNLIKKFLTTTALLGAMQGSISQALEIDLTELLFGPGRGQIVGDFKNGIAKRVAVVKCQGIHNETRIYENDPGFVLGRGVDTFWRSFTDYRAVSYLTKTSMIFYSNGVVSMRAALSVPGISFLEQDSMNDIGGLKLVNGHGQMIVSGEPIEKMFYDPTDSNLRVSAASVLLPDLKNLKPKQTALALGKFRIRVPVGPSWGRPFSSTRGMSAYSKMICKRVE